MLLKSMTLTGSIETPLYILYERRRKKSISEANEDMSIIIELKSHTSHNKNIHTKVIAIILLLLI